MTNTTKALPNTDTSVLEIVRTSENRPGGRRLVARNAEGVLDLVGEEFDALGRTAHARRVSIIPAHLDHFAGMLKDASCLSDRYEVSLDEPIYPYKILVRWEGTHRILSFISRPTPENLKGKVEFRIRLSPLEARRLANLAERCAISAQVREDLKQVLSEILPELGHLIAESIVAILSGTPSKQRKK